MPDYGFWSWPEPHIGSVDEVKERVEAIEKDLTWADKISKVIWRGTVRWNSGVRGKLVEVAKDKAWSDVEALDWKTNALTMEEFCKYKYLAYTEVGDSVWQYMDRVVVLMCYGRESLIPDVYGTFSSAGPSSSRRL